MLLVGGADALSGLQNITIVAALGLPPFSHEDDPARGVQASGKVPWPAAVPRRACG